MGGVDSVNGRASASPASSNSPSHPAHENKALKPIFKSKKNTVKKNEGGDLGSCREGSTLSIRRDEGDSKEVKLKTTKKRKKEQEASQSITRNCKHMTDRLS